MLEISGWRGAFWDSIVSSRFGDGLGPCYFHSEEARLVDGQVVIPMCVTDSPYRPPAIDPNWEYLTGTEYEVMELGRTQLLQQAAHNSVIAISRSGSIYTTFFHKAELSPIRVTKTLTSQLQSERTPRLSSNRVSQGLYNNAAPPDVSEDSQMFSSSLDPTKPLYDLQRNDSMEM